MKFLSKKCGIVWGAALAATAMATTAFLCPASATAATVEGPFFGELGVSYTAGPFEELSSGQSLRWPTVKARRLYLSSQAQRSEKLKSGLWKDYQVWTAEDLYGRAGTGLIAIPNSVQTGLTGNNESGCSNCAMVGVKSAQNGDTYDLLEAVVYGSSRRVPATSGRLNKTLPGASGERGVASTGTKNSSANARTSDPNSVSGYARPETGRGHSGAIGGQRDPKTLPGMEGDFYGKASIPSVLIRSGLKVTIQNHYYEFALPKTGSLYEDKDGSPYVALAGTALHGKQGNLLDLLSALGVTLSDWKKPFAERNGSDASKVAASDLKASVTKNGADATDDFYSGKMGVYEVVLEADSSTDNNKDVPFGKHASLTAVVMVGNPREAARKAIWDKLQLVRQKIGSKSDLPTLADGERDALAREARNAAEKAHDAVKEAAVKAIETALSEGLAALDTVLTKAELINAKHIASQQVKDAQKKARGVIAGLEGLDESERNAHVKEIDAKATSALAAINAAGTSAEVYKRAAEGTKDINNILLFILKLWGKATVLVYGGENGQPRKDLNALLKPGGGLAQSQIDGYVKRIQMLVDLATRNGGLIDLATSVNDVLAAVRQAKSGIDGVVAEAQRASREALKALAQAKAKAEAELRRIADDAKDKVSKIAGVGQGEKDAARDKIDAALKKALTAVVQADTADDARKAVADGKNAIEKILMDLEAQARKRGKPTADKSAALAATGVAVTDMALFVTLLTMLAAVGAAVTRRRG